MSDGSPQSMRSVSQEPRAPSDLDAELVHQLDGLGLSASNDPWRVERVIKKTGSEETQLVWLRVDGGGELGPYVRKLVRLDAGTGGAWRELARAERDGARFLRLPRVVACEEREGLLGVVMEYVSGPTLRELVTLTPERERSSMAARMMAGLCAAATELHEGLGQAVVHRDITPSNVICAGRAYDVPVLVDLGIARTWKPGADADTTHFGTRAYAAPEQFGFGQTDARTDVFALGLVAFFCLTGRDPTAIDRDQGFAAQGVPEAWRQVIARACAFDPNERYQSACELGEAVARIEGRAGWQPPMATPQQGRWQGALLRIWRARNYVVLPVVLFWVAINVTCFVSPPPGDAFVNPWVRAFVYLVYANYLVLVGGFLVMDKGWLRAHVRWLRERSGGQLAGSLVAVFVVLTIVFAFASTVRS